MTLTVFHQLPRHINFTGGAQALVVDAKIVAEGTELFEIKIGDQLVAQAWDDLYFGLSLPAHDIKKYNDQQRQHAKGRQWRNWAWRRQGY